VNRDDILAEYERRRVACAKFRRIIEMLLEYDIPSPREVRLGHLRWGRHPARAHSPAGYFYGFVGLDLHAVTGELNGYVFAVSGYEDKKWRQLFSAKVMVDDESKLEDVIGQFTVVLSEAVLERPAPKRRTTVGDSGLEI